MLCTIQPELRICASEPVKKEDKEKNKPCIAVPDGTDEPGNTIDSPMLGRTQRDDDDMKCGVKQLKQGGTRTDSNSRHAAPCDQSHWSEVGQPIVWACGVIVYTVPVRTQMRMRRKWAIAHGPAHNSAYYPLLPLRRSRPTVWGKRC